MDQLHQQELISLLINVLLNVVCACLYSCASPILKAWLLAHPNTLSLCLSSAHFLITLCIHLNIPHPIVAHLSRCNVVIPLMILVSMCYIACAGMNTLQPWYILRYHCNYHVKEWSSHTKRGFSLLKNTKHSWSHITLSSFEISNDILRPKDV
jgi:hypothetical protein